MKAAVAIEDVFRPARKKEPKQKKKAESLRTTRPSKDGANEQAHLSKTPSKKQSKIYRGYRTPAGSTMVMVNGNPLKYPRKHSSEGFDWGYGGSGPADLAIAILRDFCPDLNAGTLYQQFKWDLIAIIQDDSWEIGSTQIEEWLGRNL